MVECATVARETRVQFSPSALNIRIEPVQFNSQNAFAGCKNLVVSQNKFKSVLLAPSALFFR